MIIDYSDIFIDDKSFILDQKTQHRYTDIDKSRAFFSKYNYNGWMHCIDGPAILYKNNNQKVWYYDGWMHRLDGPAFETGSNNDRYYIMGKYIDKEKYLKEFRKFKYKCLDIFKE